LHVSGGETVHAHSGVAIPDCRHAVHPETSTAQNTFTLRYEHISPSPPKTGSLSYYFSVQKVPFSRYSDSIKNIRGAEVLQNEVSDDSVHIFRFGSRILPTRVNYKSQTRHATDPFYDGPVDICIPLEKAALLSAQTACTGISQLVLPAQLGASAGVETKKMAVACITSSMW
jgi:hypothetical protein